jgi:Type VI secretion system, TssC, VipB
MEKEDQIIQQDSRAVREKAKQELKPFGGLTTVSKILAQQLKLPNLKYFGSEKEEDVERREDWLEGEFEESRQDTKHKLAMLVEILENSDDVEASAAIQKQKIQDLQYKNMSVILEKSRKLEQAWRELDLFYTNAAEEELRELTIINTDVLKVDESVLVSKIGKMLDDVNKDAADLSESYSFLVAPGFIGQSLIEKLKDIAYRNKVLFLTDYIDRGSIDEVIEYANNPQLPKIGGNHMSWSRTVVHANYGLLRDKHSQEKKKMFGSPTAAVAGQLYSIDNIAQPIAGAQFGVLKGLQGIRFKVNTKTANVFDRENLNPLMNAFGGLMPFNCVTLFKGDNVELRQYNVIRTYDYISRLMKHFLNQYVFTSMENEETKLHVHKTIKNMLDRLVQLDILKSGGITKFEINEKNKERFDIKLEIIPMYVIRAFDYTIGIGQSGVVEGEENV